MNNKITMPALVALLALKTGMTKERSEEFLKEFFRLISETLQKGEAVRLNALGTFRILTVETRKSQDENGDEITIPGHNRIVFTPAPSLAEEINAPFSMFEAVEINPDAEEELQGPKPKASLEDTSGHEPEASLEESVTNEEETFHEEEKTLPKKGSFRFLWGFICGLILAMLVALGAYLFFIRGDLKRAATDNNEKEKVVEEGVNMDSMLEDDTPVFPEPLDSLSDKEALKEETAAPTPPSDKMIKDVIGDHRYLTTMAQAHYGNFNLWPYIYEENKSFLGHPDRIKPGTEVMVPPLSKYGVNPNNPEDIRKAKRLGVEIYNRFK